MSVEEETVVYEHKEFKKYSMGGHFVDMPPDWEFVPSGDPGLTRRLKSTASDYWDVKRKFGRDHPAVKSPKPPVGCLHSSRTAEKKRRIRF